jgi:predicted nucleotidyltransferase
MGASTAELFSPPAIPWREPQELVAAPELGADLDPHECGEALARLCAEPEVQVVIVFGSRARGQARADSDLDLAVIVRQPQLTPAEKMGCWQRFRAALGPLLALQVFAVEARYEEGLFPLPAPREELLVLLEREWARCESKAHALADAAG